MKINGVNTASIQNVDVLLMVVLMGQYNHKLLSISICIPKCLIAGIRKVSYSNKGFMFFLVVLCISIMSKLHEYILY